MKSEYSVAYSATHTRVLASISSLVVLVSEVLLHASKTKPEKNDDETESERDEESERNERKNRNKWANGIKHQISTYQFLCSVCDSLHSLRSVYNEIPIHMHMPEVKYVHELHTEWIRCALLFCCGVADALNSAMLWTVMCKVANANDSMHFCQVISIVVYSSLYWL